MSLPRSGGEARTQEKRTFALSALKRDLCTHPERVRQRNHRRWLSWSWPRGCKRERRRHVLPEGSCYAGHLLSQHPNADAHMSSRKGEIYQLACAPVNIFRGCAVIEDYERVGAHEKPSHDLQPHFHVMLLAYYHSHSWILFTNSVVGLVVRECWADENDVVELEAESAVDLVHQKL